MDILGIISNTNVYLHLPALTRVISFPWIFSLLVVWLATTEVKWRPFWRQGVVIRTWKYIVLVSFVLFVKTEISSFVAKLISFDFAHTCIATSVCLSAQLCTWLVCYCCQKFLSNKIFTFTKVKYFWFWNCSLPGIVSASGPSYRTLNLFPRNLFLFDLYSQLGYHLVIFHVSYDGKLYLFLS